MATDPRPSIADFHTRLSSYREALLEHLLVGEMMKGLWPRGITMDVCKPQVDATGYDLLLQCDGVMRHVQLKSSVSGSATARVNVHLELTRRQGGCVVWTHFAPEDLRFSHFLWLGGPPGEPLPDLSDCRVARHVKGNAQGFKAERPNLRVVPRFRFSEVPDVPALLERLFGADVGGS